MQPRDAWELLGKQVTLESVETGTRWTGELVSVQAVPSVMIEVDGVRRALALNAVRVVDE